MDAASTGKSTAGLAAYIATLAAAFGGLTPLLAGALQPGYSHVRQYISELGQTGAPHAVWVNWAGFVPTGVFVLLFLLLAGRSLPLRFGTLVLLSSTGWAYVLAAFFPCDPGCPDRGSFSQLIHNLTALVGYPAAIVGQFQAARSIRSDPAWRGLAPLTLACAVASAVGFGLMLAPGCEPWRGLLQRVAETATIGWIAVVGWANATRNR